MNHELKPKLKLKPNTNHQLKRRLQTALVTLSASAVIVGVSASSASAAENTWVKNLSSGACLTAMGDGDVRARGCNFGDLTQLWDRADDRTIRRAYAAQCLDSNFSGDVYWLQCNGGNYQKWTYEGNKVRNVATGMYLLHRPGYEWVDTGSSSANRTDWQFFGGS